MTKNKTLNIVQLFPDKMNIYGDNGNAQIVCHRAQLYGYKTNLLAYNDSSDINSLMSADLILGGGGQDSGQRQIIDELANIQKNILDLAHEKVPMLMICGLYQLFGHYFQTKDGDKLQGVGLFDLITKASDRRLIGNIVINNDELGDLIGYENHSGLTMLGGSQEKLGSVIKGHGNNGDSSDEGAVRYACVGTYLHGPILSKNPKLADWLLMRAVERKFNTRELRAADERSSNELKLLDNFIKKARAEAIKRPQ